MLIDAHIFQFRQNIDYAKHEIRCSGRHSGNTLFDQKSMKTKNLAEIIRASKKHLFCCKQ